MKMRRRRTATTLTISALLLFIVQGVLLFWWLEVRVDTNTDQFVLQVGFPDSSAEPDAYQLEAADPEPTELIAVAPLFGSPIFLTAI